jgi:hypothetical protein
VESDVQRAVQSKRAAGGHAQVEANGVPRIAE